MPETIIRFHPEALKEAEIAQEWYADRSTLAAYAFVSELTKGVNDFSLLAKTGG